MCNLNFTKDYSRNKPKKREVTEQYIKSTSLRDIGEDYSLSGASILRKAKEHIKYLPSNLSVTRKYCDPERFSGYLQLDGKYVSVKGYKDKIPLLWGIDYLTHDIPHAVLVPSENLLACLMYFQQLKSTGYDLKLLITDDNPSMSQAAENVYPSYTHQLCTRHQQDSIARALKVKSLEREHPRRVLFDRINYLFAQKHDPISFSYEVCQLIEDLESLELKDDILCGKILNNLLKKKEPLTNHNFFPNTPHTNNLIESYNSHLEKRLKGIRGFKSFHSAKRWLNAYVLKRRTKPFTSCGKKFKHLNKTCSLEHTLKPNTILPNFF